MATEQEVRTRAGWIGVEISRSRVRTPGKAGYGLYRVRTAAERHWHIPHPVVTPAGSWTAYAFELDVIDAQIENSIGMGTPESPADLHLPRSRVAPGEVPYVTVPTRWTHRYQGRRDLGADLERLERTDPAVGAALRSYDAMSQSIRSGTVRSRQREQNREFQAVHKVARDHGLKKRHAEKLARLSNSRTRPAERTVGGLEGPSEGVGGGRSA